MDTLFTDSEIYTIPDFDVALIEQQGYIHSDLLIVVGNEDYNAHIELFENIKKAMKINSEEDYQLLIISKDSYCPLHRIQSIELKKLIVCFGILPEKVSLEAKLPLNVLHTTESYKISFVGSLESMNEDKKNKLLFWNSIKDHV